jgi:flagellar biosynthesis protein FliP
MVVSLFAACSATAMAFVGPAVPGSAVSAPVESTNLPSAITPPASASMNANGGLQVQGLPGANVPWSIVVMLTALTLIPSVLLCVTPFARLLIVFHFLRQALGLQTTPSNQTLIGLSLILTFFLMQPVATQIYQNAIVPMQAKQITPMDALQRGEIPLRKFMVHYVREKDVALFIDLAKEPRPASVDDVSLRVLDCGYGSGIDYDVGGHAAVAASGDFNTAQTAAIPDGGWLASFNWFTYEEF